MKIICVGRNYSEHAKELNNEIPSEPVLFFKPETALLTSNNPFPCPSFSNDIHYEGELVYRICKSGKNISKNEAPSFIDAITIGIDFTARDLQTQLKQKGLPWERAKSFDNSAAIGNFIEINSKDEYNFSLNKNGNEVQSSNSKEMIFDILSIIENVSKFVSLQKGDLIFTGTPAGVGKINVGDIYEGYIQNQRLLYCKIE
jgi:2-keto-4-pentenoate hydratase/2-oxohepta-3-ene-1,7-dioic acid hydratase in catechol pathway